MAKSKISKKKYNDPPAFKWLEVNEKRAKEAYMGKILQTIVFTAKKL